MTEMIKRHKCKCTTCGQSHTVETVVKMEELPLGIECLIVPKTDGTKHWSLTIIDHQKSPDGTTMELPDMKSCLWNIENVAFRLHKQGNRFVVSTPRSRFETHSRINRAEWNDWSQNAVESKKKRLDWYSDVVARATRSYVRATNKIERVGYDSLDENK